MHIKILVPENKKEDLSNFIKICEQHGFKVIHQGGGHLPNFSGYFAELKGDSWKKQNNTETAWDLPSGVYQVSVDKATPNTKDVTCRVWFEQIVPGRVRVVCEERLK